MTTERTIEYPDEIKFAECARNILSIKRNYHLLAGAAVTAAFFNSIVGGVLAATALIQRGRQQIEENYYKKITDKN